jgi:hypothetical protein
LTPLVLGLLAPRCTLSARKVWNDALQHIEKDRFFFDYYRTISCADLELRLSEMFLLERFGYIIDPSFSSLALPLLDVLDSSSLHTKRVDTILNRGGVLMGYDFAATSPIDFLDERITLFMASFSHL